MSECTEQHNCEKRMDIHSADIRTKLPSKAFYVALAMLVSALTGSYAYTHTVEARTYENEKKLEQIVTHDDMEKLQDKLIQAIKELRP